MSRLFSVTRRSLPLTIAILLLGLFGARPILAAGTVGNGTPGSCTEAAFDAALVGGGQVKFKCGANPLTIQLTNAKTISLNTTIDGGGKITFTGATHRPFDVNSSVTLNLRNLKIKKSHDSAGGGALRSYGTVNIKNVKFIKNQSDTVGGAIENHGTLKLGNVSFSGNKAANAGGAIYNDGGSVLMQYGRFKKNQVSGSSGNGGALANYAGQVAILFVPFIQNQALDGGAIWNKSGASFITYECDYTSNLAGYGGAIENNGDATVAISTFKLNQASSDGGAVWNLTGSFLIQFASLDQNTAGTTGGAVSVYGGSMSIEKSSLTNNHAPQEGGAIYSTANLNLTNDTISTNDSDSNGGGIYHSFGMLDAVNVTISSNSGILTGGIHVTNGSPTNLRNVVLADNGINCGGTVPSNDYNFSDDNTCVGFNKTHDTQNANPYLAPLSLNGGMGQTHLPQPASPLIDHGITIDGINADERLVIRPQNSDSDIGALEICTQKPGAPNLVQPGDHTGVAPTYIWFRWEAPGCGAFYKLLVRRDSKSGTPVVQNNYLPYTESIVPRLPVNVTYFWRVSACNEVGCTQSVWRQFTTGNGPFADPDLSPILPYLLRLYPMFAQQPSGH